MTATVQEVEEAILALNPEFTTTSYGDTPDLLGVFPPIYYTTEYDVEVWIKDDEIEVACHAGYDPRILPLTATATEIAQAAIGFIEDNEKWAWVPRED